MSTQHAAAVVAWARAIAVALLAVMVLSTSGCEERSEPLTFGQVGSDRDVWLYGGGLGSSKVALVFGYLDDMKACEDLVKGHRLLYPENYNYFCSYD